MKISSISIKNVRTIAEANFNFDENFQLITGENMSGKSTIFYSILFAIGGLKQTPVSKEEFFRAGTSETKVILEFTYKGEVYILDRTKTSARVISGDLLALGHTEVTKYMAKLLNIEHYKTHYLTPTKIIQLSTLYSVESSLESMLGYPATLSYITEKEEELEAYKAKIENQPNYTKPKMAELSKSR